MSPPRRPTPTPREMRCLEDAAATEIAAGCREVERQRFRDALMRAMTGTYIDCRDCHANPTEADLARAWTAADPPADEPAGEEEPC